MPTIRIHALLAGFVATSLLVLGSLPVHAATTVISKGQVGCVPGTVVAGVNKVVNGDFSISAGDGPGIAPAASFTSELPNVGPDTYPYDESAGGFSIISTGTFTVTDRELVAGHPFLGDSSRDVPAAQHYLYTKPSNSMYADGYALLWKQQVTLTVGTTYNFYAYFNNMLTPSEGDNNFVDPRIKLLVNGTPTLNPIEVGETPDQWVPVQFSFILDGTAGAQAPVTLEIRDYAGVRIVPGGDDFAVTGISLRQCVSSLGVAFQSQMPTRNSNGTYDVPFVVTVRNYGVDPAPLRSLQLTSDLSATFAGVAAFQVISIRSTSSDPRLTVNTGFNGKADKNLLTGTDSLGSGKTATLSFTVRFTPGTGPGAFGPFNGRVEAVADGGDTGSGGGGSDVVVVRDSSSPGTNPDPNGNGSGKDPSEDVDTPIYIAPLRMHLPIIRR
jgi:hypothetical protein